MCFLYLYIFFVLPAPFYWSAAFGRFRLCPVLTDTNQGPESRDTEKNADRHAETRTELSGLVDGLKSEEAKWTRERQWCQGRVNTTVGRRVSMRRPDLVWGPREAGDGKTARVLVTHERNPERYYSMYSQWQSIATCSTWGETAELRHHLRVAPVSDPGWHK